MTSSDTIPAGFRLIPFRSTGTAFVLSRAKRHQLANDLREIEARIRAYNVGVRHLSLAMRATGALTVPSLSQRLDGTLTLVHHDSPSWAATQSPLLPTAQPVLGTRPGVPRPINPSSRAELRAYAIRRGVSPREAWHRFPPSSPEEREEMLKATAARKRLPLDPQEAAFRAYARKMKRDPKDAALRAEFQASLSSISALLGDLL